MTPEQLDNWFSYHPPTEETAPRYAAIRSAEEACHVSIAFAKKRQVCDDGGIPADANVPALYAEINLRLRRFAEVIDANAPDSADKAAAVRCVRLARNCANEAITLNLLPDAFLWTQAQEQLRLARFQANSAIACGGR
jgi:hypothetical protein